MLRAAGYFENTMSKAEQGVQHVEDTLNVLRTVWSGDAFNAYRTSMNAWFEDCKTITTALNEMINLVHGHAATTTRGEESNTAIANSIPTGPGLGI